MESNISGGPEDIPYDTVKKGTILKSVVSLNPNNQ